MSAAIPPVGYAIPNEHIYNGADLFAMRLMLAKANVPFTILDKPFPHGDPRWHSLILVYADGRVPEPGVRFAFDSLGNLIEVGPVAFSPPL